VSCEERHGIADRLVIIPLAAGVANAGTVEQSVTFARLWAEKMNNGPLER